MKRKNLRTLLLLFAIVVFVWIFSWITVDTIYPEENRGTFGDKFGFVNSLFSGLALAGIIYSILLQQKDLKIQRKELKATRDEFKEQNLQTTFFNLLETQRQIANEIVSTTTYLKGINNFYNRTVTGRQFFVHSKLEMQRIVDLLKEQNYILFRSWDEEEHFYNGPSSSWEEDELVQTRKIAFAFKTYKIDKETWEKSKDFDDFEIVKLAYSIFFNKYGFVIGHYFRHLYHILKFLNQSKENKLVGIKSDVQKSAIEKEFRRYADYIQAQMSTPELFLLFYNCLIFPKLLMLSKDYGVLENLPVEDILDKSHAERVGVILKSRKNLIE